MTVFYRLSYSTPLVFCSFPFISCHFVSFHLIIYMYCLILVAWRTVLTPSQRVLDVLFETILRAIYAPTCRDTVQLRIISDRLTLSYNYYYVK